MNKDPVKIVAKRSALRWVGEAGHEMPFLLRGIAVEAFCIKDVGVAHERL